MGSGAFAPNDGTQGVLLGTDHDGLRAVALVEEVDGGIEFLQFPDLPGIDIEEILLQGTARRDAIDDDSGTLVLRSGGQVIDLLF